MADEKKADDELSFKRSPIGRKSRLTPEIEEQVVQLLRAGNYVETAAAFAGIAKVQLYDWLRKGAALREKLNKLESQKAFDKAVKELDPRDAAYVSFHDAVGKAQAESEARNVALIQKAADKNWQAAAWRLERQHNSKWGRTDKHEISTPEDKPGIGLKIEVVPSRPVSADEVPKDGNVEPAVEKPEVDRDDG